MIRRSHCLLSSLLLSFTAMASGDGTERSGPGATITYDTATRLVSASVQEAPVGRIVDAMLQLGIKVRVHESWHGRRITSSFEDVPLHKAAGKMLDGSFVLHWEKETVQTPDGKTEIKNIPVLILVDLVEGVSRLDDGSGSAKGELSADAGQRTGSARKGAAGGPDSTTGSGSENELTRDGSEVSVSFGGDSAETSETVADETAETSDEGQTPTQTTADSDAAQDDDAAAQAAAEAAAAKAARIAALQDQAKNGASPQLRMNALGQLVNEAPVKQSFDSLWDSMLSDTDAEVRTFAQNYVGDVAARGRWLYKRDLIAEKVSELRQ